jgi:hypothetical protein
LLSALIKQFQLVQSLRSSLTVLQRQVRQPRQLQLPLLQLQQHQSFPFLPHLLPLLLLPLLLLPLLHQLLLEQ